MKHDACAHDHRHGPLPQFDQFGAIAGLLCAAHCALLPLAIGVLPSLGLEFIGTHAFDAWMVLFLGTFALIVLGLGFALARARVIWGLVVGGIALMAIGLLPNLPQLVHALLLASGGVAVALGHWINRRAIAAGSPVTHLLRAGRLVD
ncbi:MAG: MerC domain-containing protein [Ahniella sp.]|nr:MerC domain-containing protein [Ahniella sp.]